MRISENRGVDSFLILALLILSAVSGGAEIIPAANSPTAVWSVAGIPGGIPDRTIVYKTFDSSATSAAIQAAINSCPAGQVVKLNSGTYNLSNINLQAPSNWVLRGSGMGSTILNMGGGTANFYMGSYPPWGGNWVNTTGIGSGGTQGSTNLVVGSATGYGVGDLCVIDMTNADWIVGYGAGGTGGQVMNNDSAGKGRDGNRVQLHIVEITAVSGNNLSIWPPLPFALNASRAPQISKFGVRGPRWAGIEDLTFNFSGTSSAGIFGGGMYACWLKNVEVKNWGTFGVWPRWSACFEMRGCYVHEPNTYNWGKGYALQMDPCSGSLIIDNIFLKNQDTVLMQGGCAGNVIAYNFLSFSYNGYIGIDWLLQEAGANHTPFPCYNLFEGNYIGKLQPDYYYGPSGYGTILRNRITGNGPWIKQNRVAISIDAQQRYYSIVGNQLGERTAPSSITLAKPNITLNYAQPGSILWNYDPGSASFGYETPYIYRMGYPFSGNNGSSTGTAVHDAVVKIETLRHGNWDAANNSVVWNTNIPDYNIPNSLFLNAKPAWFGNLEWPPYGPSAPTNTVSDIAKIPAGYRLLYNISPPFGPLNQSPVAVAAATPSSGTAPLTVSFSAAGSFDPEGASISYSWNFGDGGVSTAVSPNHTYQGGGVFSATLTISDGGNSVTSAPIPVTVSGLPLNRPPIALAGATPMIGAAPLAVLFSSAGSSDPEGTPLTYAWAFGDGATASDANTSHSYSTVGSYVARLTVSDGTSSTAATNLVVSVVEKLSGLVAAYGFEEGSGTSVLDASGNGNGGTVSGTSWATQGKFGRALSFNGTSGVVTVTGTQSLNLTTGMTEMAWIHPTVTRNSWCAVLHRETDSYYLHASSPDGPMRPAGGATFNGAESYLAAATAIPINTWSHLAVTYDGSALKIYLNGLLAETKLVSGGIQANSKPLRIGGNSYGQYFQGYIDEVRIFNRALSGDEIQLAMTASVVNGPPPSPSNLRIAPP